MSPREAEAVAVAADALDGAGDPAALVVALVAELARRGRLPVREVAVVLGQLIDRWSPHIASQPGTRAVFEVEP